MRTIFIRFFCISILLAWMAPPVVVAQNDEIPIQTFVTCRSKYDDLMEIVDTVNEEGRVTYSNSDYESYKAAYENCHQQQLNKLRTLLDNGAGAIKNGDYLKAISFYKEAMKIQEDDALQIEQSIVGMYLSLAWEAYQRAAYEQTYDYLQNVEEYSPTRQQKFQLRYLRALYVAALDDYTNAQEYAKRAQNYAITDKEKEQIATYIDYVTNRADAPTNDPLSYQQPRLKELTITKARNSIKGSETATVAIIDNGVDTDHPDLEGRIRINSDEDPDNSIDDDGNGYVDDRYGYNFFDDTSNVDPYGEHGTQIAGIIWAISDNDVGVAGISQDVKLMPIVVCDNKECLRSDDLAAPIRYAVDNGADIINMSLVSKHATFNPELTEAITYATNQWVLVVIAAGNGIGEDEDKVGVNTTETPVSPVCNEWSDYKRIIGVWAANAAGETLSWSNYGTCVDTYTYGEKVVTTSSYIPTEEGRYLIADGTSFSAPIIAGIIALGHNSAGPVNYTTVYDALLASATDQAHPDALAYLNELDKRTLRPADQAKIDLLFTAIDRQYATYLPPQKIREYNALLTFLEKIEPKLEKQNATRKLALLYAIRTKLQTRKSNLE